jgi:hypothetical protein
MMVAAHSKLLGRTDVGRLAFRRAGEICPPYGQGPFGTGAQR